MRLMELLFLLGEISPDEYYLLREKLRVQYQFYDMFHFHRHKH